jgi:hypothetical protein
MIITDPNRADVRIELPPLNDEAVAQIHSFLEELLSLFESRYYGQIHRHHETLSGRDILRHSPDQDHDHNDPPF